MSARGRADLLRTWRGPGADLLRTWRGPAADLLRTCCGPAADLLRTWCGPAADLLRTWCGLASSSGAAFFDFFAIAGAGARMCRHVPAHFWLIP